MKKKRSPRRIARFWKIFYIYVISLTSVLIIGLCFLWNYIEDFELSRPEYAIQNLMDTFGETYFRDMLADYYSDKSNGFESIDTITEAVSSVLGNLFTYEKRATEYTAEYPVYTVKNSREIAKVTLAASEKNTFFGFTVWTVKSVEFTADISDITPDTITVKVPQTFSIKINGIELSDKYLVSTVKYETPVKWDAASVDLPYRSLYEISGFYGDPDIVISDPDGEPVSFSTVDDSVCDCDFPEKMRYPITLTVPSDASVSVGGVPLTADEISCNNVPYKITNPFNEAAKNKPYQLTYTVKGFLGTPMISVISAAGEALEPASADGNIYFYGYPASQLYTITISVPDKNNFIPTVNGIGLTDMYIRDEGNPYGDTEGIDSYITGQYTCVTYEIDGLYSLPDVYVTDTRTGKTVSCEATAGTYDYVYGNPVIDSLHDEHDALVKSFVEAYVWYAANGGVDTEKNYAAVNELLLPDSQAYYKMLSTKMSFSINLQFQIKRLSYKSYDYQMWGENCFSCYTDFTADLYCWKDVTDTVEGLRLFYILYNGQWLLAKIVFT